MGSPIVCTILVLPPLQNLENEISSHRTLSQVVMGTGHKLVQAGHFAAEEVAARVQQLEEALDHLQTEAARRRRMLRQALEAQQILMEVRERMLWDAEMSELRTWGVHGTERWLQGQAEPRILCFQSGAHGAHLLYLHCFF